MEKIALEIIEKLKKVADKGKITLVVNEKSELQLDAGEMRLLRTTQESSITYVAIKNNKRGILKSNNFSEDGIKADFENLMQICESGVADPCYDIASDVKNTTTTNGPLEPDLELLYKRVREFGDAVKNEFPKTILETVTATFHHDKTFQYNTNSVQHISEDGYYQVVAMFTSKDGEATSSFNYSVALSKELDSPIMELAQMKNLLKQSSEQTKLQKLEGKFEGDLIVTPDCLGDFIQTVTLYLSDSKMISGDSPFKKRLNEKLFHPSVTIRTSISGKDLAVREPFTSDGFVAEDYSIIEGGVLKSYILSLYGANKTGEKRSKNISDLLVMEAGETSFNDLVKNVKRGILLCRFSGGRIGPDLNFSGVAKNSYYIEDGKILYPVSEVMVSGNVQDLFTKVNGISKERVNFGYTILPWVSSRGVTISAS